MYLYTLCTFCTTWSNNLQIFFHTMYIHVCSLTDSIFLNDSVQPARPPDLCRVQALPPWGLGGLCGIWHGSDGTPQLEGAWRHSRGVEHTPHSWRGSGRVWAQAHGLCEGCTLISRSLKAPRLLPDSYSHPRWHRGSKQKGTRDERERDRQGCQSNIYIHTCIQAYIL